ncbi:hypothetical protein SARC_01910 [Sphaeroforma arctica JP610]|uniref:Uncharacterized protein n=1 Tax=Sphaeroforma arctica JP610 TaxID=667725 RepID=A0A0L0GA54_9EUKA|nr:hypothetical protein SARC_01910 [Sphaeroforma arctica JP610]KNC85917.1 hypothetical protein SARC_01910 [Sphaeroforma arctica JP610]|eukprot:XP_014159819.1 hypothetical protein SARC_01910 [Sphaeroforma arctica JP610]
MEWRSPDDSDSGSLGNMRFTAEFPPQPNNNKNKARASAKSNVSAQNKKQKKQPKTTYTDTQQNTDTQLNQQRHTESVVKDTGQVPRISGRDMFVFFCSHQRDFHGDKAEYSNWYPSEFKDENNVQFMNMEQYMI